MLLQLQRRLVEQAPHFLRHPLKLVPRALQSRVMETLLAKVFHEAIVEGDFDFLAGRWLKVAVTDLDLCWFITLQEGVLKVAPECAEIDVSFSGEANDLLLIAGRKEDPDALFFQRRLKIEGDTELGLEVKNLLDSLDMSALPALIKYPLADLAELVCRVRSAPQQGAAGGEPSVAP
ncbi:ubiquinone anaerobic biosynthesis accessory factor UbiT [Aeromonas simiae]|uniref:Ubiquinone biosynthesis accessory factor UbiT n=1 Tax=Aeromonas simiae TaxID=218936 RepID=A0A5J6WYQ2_9GAMM|nr:SCP2 sterol-binding domain-containing protein [Aeromonas simiae]QFI55434.1 lipid carrier protein [Aeromonas simiae]